jgi:hypothetical protein
MGLFDRFSGDCSLVDGLRYTGKRYGVALAFWYY